jgi:hypothetical protein
MVRCDRRRTDEEWDAWVKRRKLAALDYEKRHRDAGTSRKDVSIYHNTRHRFDKITPRCLAYWQRKVRDPNFHPGSWGGRRWSILTTGEELHVRARLWIAVAKYKRPQMSRFALLAGQFATHLRRQQNPHAASVSISVLYARRIFYGWNWTWKVAQRSQLAKFTPSNIFNYVHHTIAISLIPYHRIKFLDETKIVSRGPP